jgi:hypothetical protein
MGHDEQTIGLAGIERDSFRRSSDGEPRSTEHEQVEVELPRTPALALDATERALQLLERDEEGDRPGRGIRAGRDVEADDRVPERGLVDTADGGRDIQPRDGVEPGRRQDVQRSDPARQRVARLAEVRSQPDVRPNASQVAAPSALDSAG